MVEKSFDEVADWAPAMLWITDPAGACTYLSRRWYEYTGQSPAEVRSRAEQRLAEGRYGLSIESGDPIPDERLEAIPTAERTVAEEERFDRGA